MLSAIATLTGMLIMLLFPVLIPAMVSGVHFAARWRRNSKDRHSSGRIAYPAKPDIATA